MKDEDRKIVTVIGGCLIGVPLVIVVAVASALLDGWAISRLWAWFLVPLGVPAITIVHAIGISLLFSLFKPHVSSSSDKKKGLAVLLGTLIAAFLVPLLAVGMGWIVVQFM